LNNIDIKVLWKEAQIRGDKEKLENLKIKQELGVTRNQLWQEAGYSQAIITKMEGEVNGQDSPTE
jgi:predicted transcriptional regulator